MAAQPGWPSCTVPSCSPLATRSPAPTVADTGSYVVRSPPGWSTDTTPRPATAAAKTTVPAPAASTVAPATEARSTPRCPGPYGTAGALKARTTVGRPASGQPNIRVGSRDGSSESAVPGGTARPVKATIPVPAPPDSTVTSRAQMRTRDMPDSVPATLATAQQRSLRMWIKKALWTAGYGSPPRLSRPWSTVVHCRSGPCAGRLRAPALAPLPGPRRPAVLVAISDRNGVRPPAWRQGGGLTRPAATTA